MIYSRIIIEWNSSVKNVNIALRIEISWSLSFKQWLLNPVISVLEWSRDWSLCSNHFGSANTKMYFQCVWNRCVKRTSAQTPHTHHTHRTHTIQTNTGAENMTKGPKTYVIQVFSFYWITQRFAFIHWQRSESRLLCRLCPTKWHKQSYERQYWNIAKHSSEYSIELMTEIVLLLLHTSYNIKLSALIALCDQHNCEATANSTLLNKVTIDCNRATDHSL